MIEWKRNKLNTNMIKEDIDLLLIDNIKCKDGYLVLLEVGEEKYIQSFIESLTKQNTL